MSNITENANLEPHYANNSKVTSKDKVVVKGPEEIPRYQLFNDAKANIRLSEIDRDIYEDSKKIPKKKDKNKFLGIF